jgi:hypothetical protein
MNSEPNVQESADGGRDDERIAEADKINKNDPTRIT